MACCKTFTVEKKGSSLINIKPLFSFDGKYIICSHGNAVRVYSTATGLCVHTLLGHSKPVISCVFNPINKMQLWTFDGDGTLNSWDYLDGSLIKSIQLKALAALYNVYAVGKRMYACVKDPTAVDGGSKSGDDGQGTLMQIHMDYKLSSSRSQHKKLLYDIKLQANTIAFDNKGRYIANVGGEILRIYNNEVGKMKRHFISDRYFTCVACHPSDLCVATGDNTGRILLWYNFLTSNNPAKNRLHWHTNPVMDLDFTSEGSYLYSCGSECVLVKWLCKSGTKDYLPRLGAPLRYVTVDKHTNAMLATTHDDNGIRLIDSQMMKVQHIIQGLTRNQQVTPSTSIGILVEPRTGSLLMNGRIGHLQLYSWQQDQQIYNLDICGHNLVTRERGGHSKLVNVDVAVAAVSDCGHWLLTVESRDDGGVTTPESTLKFWQYRDELQTYELNTCVTYPHEGPVACAAYRHVSPEHTLRHVFTTCCSATAGSEATIKHWTLLPSGNNTDTGTESWSCTCVLRHRVGMPSGPGHGSMCSEYSADGSVLAVGLLHSPAAASITLWTDTAAGGSMWQPVDTLTPPPAARDHCPPLLRGMCFGHGACSDLLVSAANMSSHSADTAATATSVLHVWSVISGQLLREIKLIGTVHCVIADNKSEYMATFTSDAATDTSDVYIFRADQHYPSHVHQHVSDATSHITHAVFIPSLPHCQHAHVGIAYINTQQEVGIMTCGCTDSDASRHVDIAASGDSSSDVPAAAAGPLYQMVSSSSSQHQRHSIDVNTSLSSKLRTHVSSHAATGSTTNLIHDLLSTPVHMLPPTSLLCHNLLLASLNGPDGSQHTAGTRDVDKATADRRLRRGSESDSDAESSDDDDAGHSDPDGDGIMNSGAEEHRGHVQTAAAAAAATYKHLRDINMPTDIDYSWITSTSHTK